VYSSNRTVTLWSTSTHTPLGLVEHSQEINSIALSPDNRFLAIGGKVRKIALKCLSRITDSIPLSRLHPTFQEPDIHVNHATLDAWKHDQFENAEALLTTAINESQDASHHLLAARALTRARLREWDAALVDAKMAIDIQPSIIAYIAKSAAHVGKGERDAAYRACDIAFAYSYSSHATLLLFIKAIIVCMAGEHHDAISRMDDLIATVPSNSTCSMAQSYMYLMQGNLHMKRSNHESAIQSFERARAQLHDHRDPVPLVVSLMSGWKFGDLHITVRQRLCEALYAAGRKMDASESLLELVNTFDEEVNSSVPVTKWVSDFTKQCLSTIENDNDAVSNATSTPFLRQWAKSTLASAAWRDVMVASASFTLLRVTVYCVVCEHLESMERMTDAVECFHEMTNDLGEEVYASGPTSEWVCDFMQRQLSTPRRDQAESSTRHTTLTILLRDWVKAKLTRVSWKDALVSAIGFELPRVAVYQTICECLKMNDHITDAVECFHQMISELGEANLEEHMEWARGE
jgi:tetratricopeptide (TPR) repeat protein